MVPGKALDSRALINALRPDRVMGKGGPLSRGSRWEEPLWAAPVQAPPMGLCDAWAFGLWPGLRLVGGDLQGQGPWLWGLGKGRH